MWTDKYLICVILIQLLLLKVVDSTESSNSMDGDTPKDNLLPLSVNSVLLNRDEANSFLNKERTRLLLTKRQLKDSKLTHVNRRFLKTRCNAGQWFEEEYWSDKCNSCGHGRYQDKDGHYDSSCKACPTGTYMPLNSGTSCGHCTAGQYQNQNAQAGCKHCPVGQYQNQNVQAGCKHCPTGQYQNQNVQYGCEHCPVGQYQNENANYVFHDTKNWQASEHECVAVNVWTVSCPDRDCATNWMDNADNILFHFNPRGGSHDHTPNKIVMNTRSSGSWKSDSHSLVNPPGPLQAKITATRIGFEVRIGGSLVYTYNHILPWNTFTHIQSDADASVQKACYVGCKSCSVGQYQDQNKQTGCKHCPGGQYHNQNLQTGCKHCSSGKFFFPIYSRT